MSIQKLPKVTPLFKNAIQKQEIALKMAKHRQKIWEAKKNRPKYQMETINPNVTYRDLFEENHKKNYMLETKYLQIQRQNRLLFEKINKINQKKRKTSKQETFSRTKSLNVTMRKKQIQQIQLQNARIFGRIQKQKPSISFRQSGREYNQKRKLSQKLSKIEKYRLEDWY